MTDRGRILLLLALLAAGCGGAAPRSRAELTNPFLGPEYSTWLIGPIARIATSAEIEEYLALQNDQEATAFIEAFWLGRDPSPSEPGNPLRETFDERVADADRLYSEAGILGRRTDRGALYVVYGAPAKVEFEVSPVPSGPPIEVWNYGANAPSGLDGKRPASVLRFSKRGDLTVLYSPGAPTRSLVPPPEPNNL